MFPYEWYVNSFLLTLDEDGEEEEEEEDNKDVGCDCLSISDNGDTLTARVLVVLLLRGDPTLEESHDNGEVGDCGECS